MCCYTVFNDRLSIKKQELQNIHERDIKIMGEHVFRCYAKTPEAV